LERDTELIIHADRPFANTVAGELVKPMTGWRLKILNPRRRIKALKTSPGHLDQVSRETLARVAALEDRSRLWGRPALDRHDASNSMV